MKKFNKKYIFFNESVMIFFFFKLQQSTIKAFQVSLNVKQTK